VSGWNSVPEDEKLPPVFWVELVVVLPVGRLVSLKLLEPLDGLEPLEKLLEPVPPALLVVEPLTVLPAPGARSLLSAITLSPSHSRQPERPPGFGQAGRAAWQARSIDVSAVRTRS
jgi:hypothetical protein